MDAPAANAKELYELLKSKDSGWDMDNVQLLRNGEATKNNILAALDWLITNAGEGDVVLFAYNGHGSFVDDVNGDEWDRRDEVIVTWEHAGITDDTLGGKFDEIDENNIKGMFLIFDCCFSGGLIDWKKSMVEKQLLHENQRDAINKLSKPTMFTAELMADINTKNRVVIASAIPRGIGLELRGPDGWFSFTTGVNTAIEKEKTTAEDISRYAKWWWLTNPTFIKILFYPYLWYESLLYFLEYGVIIAPIPLWKDRYPELLPKSKKLPILGFCNVESPIISDPLPKDGAQYISTTLSHLSFHLKDYQGDLMDYTIETVPDIGSASGSGVGDGTYTVDVSGLDYSREYKWYVNVTDGVNWNHKLFVFQTEPQMVFNPFDEGWNYRKKITINHTMVDGDLIDFPVLVSTVDSDIGDKAQDDGDDLLIMDGDGVATRLFHEIEYFDSSTGELVAWVNVTNLASNQDTMLYMYYGYPSCCSQQAPELVWDSDYVMVQHLQETSGVHYDSTSNNMDGNPIGGVSQDSSGMIDGADSFDGNGYVDITGSSGLEDDTMTISVWVKKDSLCGATEERVIMGKHQSGQKAGYLLEDFRDEGWAFYVGHSSDGVRTTAGETYDTSIFYHVVGVYDNGDMELYVNGSSKASDTVAGMTHTDANVNIGRICSTHYWHGGIDEVRISKSVRSPTWISTEYNNQNDPSIFLSFGPEETGPQY